MDGLVVRETVTLAGQAGGREQPGVRRRVLGPGHSCAGTAISLASRLFGNSAPHSGPGAMYSAQRTRSSGPPWGAYRSRPGR
jgi:hypothetical protein